MIYSEEHSTQPFRSKMGLPGMSEGVVFCPVPCEIVCYEPERVGVSFLKEAMEKPAPIRRDLQQVCLMSESLDRLLQQALEYVQSVLVSPSSLAIANHPFLLSLCLPYSFSTLSPFHFSTFLPPSSLSLTLSFLYLSLPPYILGTVDLSFHSPFACILLQLFVFPTGGVLFSPQAGKVAGNPTAGRKLMEAVSCIPQMEETKFESILNSTMQVNWESNSSLLLGEYHQSNIRDATHTTCCMRYRLATCIRTLRKSCGLCCVGQVVGQVAWNRQPFYFHATSCVCVSRPTCDFGIFITFLSMPFAPFHASCGKPCCGALLQKKHLRGGLGVSCGSPNMGCRFFSD